MAGAFPRPQKGVERRKQAKRSFNAEQGKRCGVFKNAADKFLLPAFLLNLTFNMDKLIIDTLDYDGNRVVLTEKKWQEKSIVHPELKNKTFLKNLEDTIKKSAADLGR